jgi:hypothetical protein
MDQWQYLLVLCALVPYSIGVSDAASRDAAEATSWCDDNVTNNDRLAGQSSSWCQHCNGAAMHPSCMLLLTLDISSLTTPMLLLHVLLCVVVAGLDLQAVCWKAGTILVFGCCFLLVTWVRM